VSNYELITKLEKLDYFNDLLKQGIVPINWTTYKQIYEFYCVEKQKEKGKQLITNVCEKFRLSESSVYEIIKKMKG